jgi:hypothetical protein
MVVLNDSFMMESNKMREETLDLKIYKTHPKACRIEKAEKTLKNTADNNGIKWCMPYKIANQMGFWIYPPIDFEITWHGGKDFTYKNYEDYDDSDYGIVHGMLRAPELAKSEKWNHLGIGRSKFTYGLVEAGVVQVYTGCIFKTSPNWCMQIRSPINFPERQPYYVMEGILETDWMQYDIWINLVFTQKFKPLRFKPDDQNPIAQLVPVHRQSFTSDWDMNTKMINDDSHDAKSAARFYIDYNVQKFTSGGNNNISDYDKKDSTTFVKQKQKNLNKDGSCKVHEIPARTKRKLLNIKRKVSDDKQ